MFGLLDDEDEVTGAGAGSKDKKDQDQDQKGQDQKGDQKGQDQKAGEAGGDGSSWTDVASTKSRRLAPQWTSTKQEAPAPVATEVAKKKGVCVCVYGALPHSLTHSFSHSLSFVLCNSAAIQSRGYHGPAQTHTRASGHAAACGCCLGGVLGARVATADRP